MDQRRNGDPLAGPDGRTAPAGQGVGSDDVRGLPPSPLYNMGLAGTPPQSVLKRTRGYGWAFNGRRIRDSYPVLGLQVDKLRLSAWVVGRKPDDLGKLGAGLHAHQVGKGRRRGHSQPIRCRGWTKPPKSEGGVYYELTDLDQGAVSLLLTAEFNPAKSGFAEFVGIALTAHRLGVRSLDHFWVDRVDAAIDYQAPRRALILDDRLRRSDHFEVGPWGPQTERTGFRAGSRLKYQLYDKTAERLARGHDARQDVTRFEVQLLKPSRPTGDCPLWGEQGGTEAWRLTDLGAMPWGGRATVRVFPFDPLTVADFEFFGFLTGTRGQGIRWSLNFWRKVAQKKHAAVNRMLELGCPEVRPTPAAVWRSGWAGAVETVTAAMQAAWGLVTQGAPLSRQAFAWASASLPTEGGPGGAGGVGERAPIDGPASSVVPT